LGGNSTDLTLNRGLVGGFVLKVQIGQTHLLSCSRTNPFCGKDNKNNT